jgi:hypothetical protein
MKHNNLEQRANMVNSKKDQEKTEIKKTDLEQVSGG